MISNDLQWPSMTSNDWLTDFSPPKGTVVTTAIRIVHRPIFFLTINWYPSIMNNRSKNYDKEKQNGYPGAEDYLTFVPLFGCFIVLAFATQNVNHDCCVGGGKDTRGGAEERNVPGRLSRLFHYHTSQVSLLSLRNNESFNWTMHNAARAAIWRRKHCQRHYGPRCWLLWPVILVW